MSAVFAPALRTPRWAEAVPTTIERAPQIAVPKRRKRGEDAGTVELVIRFCAWAQERRQFPSTPEIQGRFAVSDATAARWRRALADGYGIDLPTDRPEEYE